MTDSADVIATEPLLEGWMAREWWFPFLVFSALLGATLAGITFLNLLTQDGDIPVSHGVTTSAASERGFDSALVDQYAVDFLRTTKVRGLVIAITSGDEVLHTAGYGRSADGAPLTPDTPMPVASLSKSMTAAAVMRLVEDGAISLDAPVRSYLPTFKPIDKRGAEVTVRQLLDQTSGLPSLGRGGAPARSTAELIERLDAEHFEAEPGATWAYNNANYALLAALIEQVGGEPFAAHLERRIFSPLGMDSSTSYPDTENDATPVARGHRLLYGAPLLGRAPRGELILGAGGVVSSANDLARWLVVQSTGGMTAEGVQLLSPESVALMHEPAPGRTYAFGWQARTKSDGTPFVRHAGRNVVYAAYEAVFPDSGVSYAIAWNTLHPFAAEQAGFIEGVYAILSGAKPDPLLRFGFIVDGACAVLTALMLSIGVVGVVRAGDLAQRRAPATVMLRTAPYLLGVAAAASLPPVWLGVSWAEMVSVWPAFAVLLAAAGLAAISVVGARALRLTLGVASPPAIMPGT